MRIRVVVLLLAGLVPAGAAACELDRPVVFADLDWDSNRFHTAVARHIVRHGYGCEVDAIPGSTIPLLTALGRGVPGGVDVMMEVWRDNVTAAWNAMEAKGKVREVGINFPDAIQGWFVPRYVIEGDAKRGIAAMAPGLRNVSDLPRYKTLFADPEEPAKGRFLNCILGWACEVVNSNKLEAYGLTDHYTNFRPGTGAALAAAIGSAYKRGKPVLAYYWSPTWLLGLYDMVKLEEPPYNKADWEALPRTKRNATAYPVIVVTIGVNTHFADAAPTLVRFLSRYRTTAQIVNEALAFMRRSRGTTIADAAKNFLESRPAVWKDWVPDDVGARVRASLQAR